MKRQKRKGRKVPQQAMKTVPDPIQTAKPKRPDRRAALRSIGVYGAIAAAVLGGGGYLINDTVAHMYDHDLSRIGNGVPTVVQIHDPECPTCRALQRETMAALTAFEDDELQYVIANIATAEGRRFAAHHGVAHVTLLLMDADGKRRRTLVGEARSDVLLDAFRRHVDRYNGS